MAKYDDVFGAYNAQKGNTWRARQRFYDDVFGKQEPANKDDGGFLDAIKAQLKFISNPLDAFIPDGALPFLGGMATETAGNFLDAATKSEHRRPWLDSLIGKIQDTADSALEYGKSKVTPADFDTHKGAFSNAYDSGFHGVFGGLAGMIHSDKAAKALDEAAQMLTDQTPVDPEFSREYFTNPHGFARSVGQTAGSMAAIMPSMALMPGGAEAGIARALGAGAIERALVNRGLTGVAQQFAKGAPGAVRYALTSAPVEALSEGGHVRTESLAQGVGEDEATRRSLVTAAENVPVLAGSNFLEGLLLGAPFLKGTNSILKNIAQGVGRAGLNAGQQALEEGTQYAISAEQLGDPYSVNPFDYSPEQAREFWEGFYGSLPLAGAAGTYHAVQRPKKESDTYLGEDGGGEGKHWVRQGDRVSFIGAQPQLLNAVDMLAKKYYEDTGKKLVVTAGTNGDHPSNGSEHGHDAGWKVDVNDFGFGEEGALTTDDGSKGWYADKLIDYGRSLGLGMNWEGDHIDVTLDGTQWDGNGSDAGGFLSRDRKTPEPEQEDAARESVRDAMNPKGVDTFMRAISGQESGSEEGDYNVVNSRTNATGRFQIIPDTWARWLKDLNLPADTPMTPENQNRVARNKMLEMYNEFGNWRDVAIAWYAGEDEVRKPRLNRDAKQGNNDEPSVNEYADSVMARFEKLGGEETKGQTLQSRADEIYRDKLSQETAPREEEPAKPLFDLNAEDDATQKLFEQFAQERRNSNDSSKAFFENMFVDDVFQNTKENRDAIRRRYTTALPAWFEDNYKPAETAKPESPKQNAAPKENRTAGDPLIYTARNHLEKLNAENNPDKAQITLQLNRALKSGDRATIENILNREGIPITAPQEKSATPEKTSAKPKTSATEKKIKTASAQVKTGNKNLKARKKQGAVLAELALQNNIEIPNAEIIALTNGSTKAVQKWRDNLMAAGVFNVAPQEKITPPEPTKPQVTPVNSRIDTLQEQDDAKADEEISSARERWNAIKGYSETRGKDKQRREDVFNLLPDTDELNDVEERQSPQAKDTENIPNQPKAEKQSPQTEENTRAEEISNQNAESERTARQEVTPQKQNTETQTEQPAQENGIYDDEAEVDTESGAEYPVRYKVVEADNLNVSHRVEGSDVVENPDYKGIQPRDRERRDMKQKLISMANNLLPKKLLDMARSVNAGAPVVRQDGTVLNGNGRSAAIVEAYKIGKADEYKAALIKNAKKFGLDADKIAAMDKPILVREVTKADLSEEEMTDFANVTQGGSQISASEQAKKDAKKISEATLSLFSPDSVYDFTAPALTQESKELLHAVLQDIATPDEISGYTDKDGRIGKAGIVRAMQAIFAYAYPNNTAIQRLSESTDDNVKSISNALLSAASDIATLRAAMERGIVHKYDLNAIIDAVEKLSSLRDEGKKVSDFLKEIQFDGMGLSDEARKILSVFDKNKRSAKKITKFLRNIAQGIRKQGDPREDSFFGDVEPEPLIDIINRAERDMQEDDTPSLFDKDGAKKGEPETDTSIGNVIDDEDLTPAQKLLQEFGKTLGVKVKFVDNPDGRFRGMHTGGVTYLNVNANQSLGKVFWHETMHWLKNSNPELFKQLAKAAGITDEQRQAYLERTGRTDLADDAAIDEEIICDQMEDVASRSGLLQNIAGKNRGLIEHVVAWLQDTFKKFRNFFRNPQGGLTTKQSQALADEFGKVANQLVDPNGEKIFRYNRSTHTVELADGRTLTPPETKKAVFDGAFTPSGRLKNPWKARQAIQEALAPLKGIPIFNKSTGIVAQFGREGAGKLVSDKAIKSSITNGFTERQHFEAAINIKQLFENAHLAIVRPDRDNDANIKSIKYFDCNTSVLGDDAVARIMVKESVQHGHHIYTIELQELNKPVELKNHAADDSSTGSKGSTLKTRQDSTTVAEEPSIKNISQTERGDNTKYSIGNDNSEESITQKIKGKLASIFSREVPTQRRNKRITQALSKLTGCRVAFGHMNGDETIIDDFHKVIRSPHAYEWKNLLPKIGGKIAQSLKLTPSEAMNNYVADWLIDGALNNTSDEANFSGQCAKIRRKPNL